MIASTIDSVRVGTWTLASGNSCDVTLSVRSDGHGDLWCAWDRAPLSPEERADYLSVVQPQIVERVAALLGLSPLTVYVV